MSWATAIKTVVKLYKWKLLALALALVILILAKNSATVNAAKLPPGSGPTPNIDPL